MADYTFHQYTSNVNGCVYHNGKLLPPLPNNRKANSITQIDDKLYVNGYEWKGNQWKKTLKALWHKYF